MSIVTTSPSRIRTAQPVLIGSPVPRQERIGAGGLARQFECPSLIRCCPCHHRTQAVSEAILPLMTGFRVSESYR